ncbi:hypothetical protein ACQVTS_29890 [Bacillus mycoides]|uniref:hypothetical protein n=1 Tax=Bacillus mycoides TaxID=1405 RepID=UPI003D6483AB
MKITASRFENETYKCYQCDKEIESEKINRETWECDHCNSKVVIDIGEECGVLVRIHPSEIRKYDNVFNQYKREFCEVKGDPFYNGKIYFIPIAGHGSLPVGTNEFVNCM